MAAVSHEDPAADCRAAFADGPAACGPGADIVRLGVDPAGPIVLTIDLAQEPQYDVDFQWLVEFAVSDLACGLTNSVSTGSGYTGTGQLGAYGYRVVTNESAPAGACDGRLEGMTATLVFNIQPPQGPWTVSGGTQHVEIQNLDDDGSADDVIIDMTPGG